MKETSKLCFPLLFLSLFLVAPRAFADSSPVDGTYDARIRTDSGTYRVPVEVEDGEVTSIRWPNGGRMRLRGAEIEDGEAVGRSSDGDRFRIEIDDLEYEGHEETESE